MTDLGAGATPHWKLAGGDPGPSSTYPCVEALRADGGLVVSVHGPLDSRSANVLARELLELLAQPIGALHLDLAAVTFVDSSGIGVLTIARTHADQRGIGFALRATPGPVVGVLDVAGML